MKNGKLRELLGDNATTIKDFLLDLIFPKICVACGKISQHLCNECQASIKPVFGYKVVPQLDEVMFIWHYDNQVIKALIKSFKYDFIIELANNLNYFFHQLDYSNKLKMFSSADFLVPVPLHQKRQLWRGFNQSLIIAELLAQIINLPVKNDLITRVVATKQQARLGLTDRLLNLQAAFKVIDLLDDSLISKKIILIDDVLTTGATLTAMAQALRSKGFSEIKAIVLAA